MRTNESPMAYVPKMKKPPSRLFQALTFSLLFQSPATTMAQTNSLADSWPDNIIVTKRLMGSSRFDPNQLAQGEAATNAVCSMLGKLYEPGTLRKIMDGGDIVISETTYLSGRKKLVVTESLMKASETNATCISSYRLGSTYRYTSPEEAWTVIRSPKGTYSPSQPSRKGSALIQTSQGAYESRLRNYLGKWRRKRYESVETHFDQRCGYPMSPSNLPKPTGMGDFGAYYDKAMAAAQEFHQNGPKLCYLINSPEHVGTGEKLVLHFKDPTKDFNEETGCYDFRETAGPLKKKCRLKLVGFQINAAMPANIFEKPE